jgi:hypothetical protein
MLRGAKKINLLKLPSAEKVLGKKLPFRGIGAVDALNFSIAVSELMFHLP